MNHRIASALAFSATVAAVSLAAAVMAGSALAETPTIDNTPFVSSRTRADVRAELTSNRARASTGGGEWAKQLNEPQQINSGYTRAHAQADYIAARDEVRAMTAEHGGSGHFAYAPARAAGTVVAGGATR